MLGGNRCGSEGDLESCLGDEGLSDQPAPLDDDEGGDKGVSVGSGEICQGLRVGEVGEEAGEEGDEAVERPLDHAPSLLSFGQQFRSIFADEEVDDDIGGRSQETDAGAAAVARRVLRQLRPAVDLLNLGKN